MGYLVIIVFGVVFYGIIRQLNRKSIISKRGEYIDRYAFPRTIQRRLQEKYPHLSDSEAEDVMEGLRDYLHICNAAGKKMVSMPSQAVDVVWHEFILFTMQYQHFCKKALGRFLHHVPAEAMKTPVAAQQGIKLAWKIACQREGISPKSPTRLPRLFALDAMLNIPNGFTYQLNCQRNAKASGSSCGGYCASHIGCSSGCGASGCSSDNSDGGGCGGGCGGGGD